MAGSGNSEKQSDCEHVYDDAAGVMGVWAAAHPSAPALRVAAAAFGTHVLGEVVCQSDGINVGPPPSFSEGKIGYNPANQSAPTFGEVYHTPMSNEDLLAKFFGGVAEAITDIREKVIEEPFYGRSLSHPDEGSQWPKALENQPSLESFYSMDRDRDIER